MNYKIIGDRDKLKEFINWLPDTGQQFYVSLFSRKKYCTQVPNPFKADKGQLKRFVSSKKYLLQKIEKLEIEVGKYYHDNISVPQETLALYITPNPRSFELAMWATIEQIQLELKRKTYKNPQAIALNTLQTACDDKRFYGIDIDKKEGYNKITLEEIQSWMYSLFGHNIKYNLIDTKNGYHILVHLKSMSNDIKKNWYQSFTKFKSSSFDITMNGDNMIPVPGGIQGNYIPKLV